MKVIREVSFLGNLPELFFPALEELKEDLAIEIMENSEFPITLEKGECLKVKSDGKTATITYSTRVECFRGLSLLFQRETFEALDLVQPSAYHTLGVMFDNSRNAVLKPETIRFYLRKMALMGFDLGMMYTEDTYEVPQYPYFGYMRGRYSQAELKDLDDYAYLFGIELCPCIQTLGHLNRAMHWPQMSHLKDTEEVIFVGEEQTYRFLRTIIEEASRPYRSNRIHIGMDEAHFLGLGSYLRKNGYTQPYKIMKEHLNHLQEILHDLGLNAMMWSDMYFRLNSPSGGYYDGPFVDPAVVADAPKDISLVYWDYYHQDQETYDEMFQKHTPFQVPVAFAGGIWTWTGPAPHYKKTIETNIPGLLQAKKHHADLVLATAWGDNGAEANFLTTLYGLQLYAEMNYMGSYEEEYVKERFRHTIGANPDAFLNLTSFNEIPGVKDWALRPVNASKFLLYQDPLVQLYEKDLDGVEMADHYYDMEKLYSDYVKEAKQDSSLIGKYMTQLWEFYALLAKTLHLKCSWHQLAGPCVRASDYIGAKYLVSLANNTTNALKDLRKSWYKLWNMTNKSYGFEILDLRISGMIGRMETAAAVMTDFVTGELDTIPELMEEPLPYTLMNDGALRGSYAWNEIASACKLDL